jgi:hypothetical protein
MELRPKKKGAKVEGYKRSEPPRKYVCFVLAGVFWAVACGSVPHPLERYGMNGNTGVITSTTTLFLCQGKKAKGR